MLRSSTNELFAGVVDEIVKLVGVADPKLGKNLEEIIAPMIPRILEEFRKQLEGVDLKAETPKKRARKKS